MAGGVVVEGAVVTVVVGGSAGVVVVEPGKVVLVVLLVVLLVGGTAYWLWKVWSYFTSTEGAAKSVCGKSRSALYMNFAHIWAGKLPPVTLMPWTLVMGVFAFGKPIHTAVDRFGV